MFSETQTNTLLSITKFTENYYCKDRRFRKAQNTIKLKQ